MRPFLNIYIPYIASIKTKRPVLYFETLAQGVIYSYNKTTKGKLFENLIICSNSR